MGAAWYLCDSSILHPSPSEQQIKQSLASLRDVSVLKMHSEESVREERGLHSTSYVGLNNKGIKLSNRMHPMESLTTHLWSKGWIAYPHSRCTPPPSVQISMISFTQSDYLFMEYPKWRSTESKYNRIEKLTMEWV